MQLNTEQQVFMLFFAIVWGSVANAQPRWKAFQWPLVFKVPQACCRVLLSLAVLNILPVAYFGYNIFVLDLHNHACENLTLSVLHIVLHGVIPAFAVFGFYRLWLGIIECYPNRFYKSSPKEIDSKYRHVEPTFITNATQERFLNSPVVELTPSAAFGNVATALIYIAVGLFVTRI